jgi:hypothetical protein
MIFQMVDATSGVNTLNLPKDPARPRYGASTGRVLPTVQQTPVAAEIRLVARTILDQGPGFGKAAGSGVSTAIRDKCLKARRIGLGR